MSTTDETIVERAKRSAHISLVFEAAVRRIFGTYSIEMIRPEGGARALLHIRLVTNDGASFALGWANPADGSAELHTLGHTLALSKRRRGRELALPPLSYARFLDTAQRVLEDFGMVVTVVAYTKDDLDSDDVEPDSVDAADSEAPRRTPTLPFLGPPRDS